MQSNLQSLKNLNQPEFHSPLRSVLFFQVFMPGISSTITKPGFSGRGDTFPWGFPEASALPRHGLGLNHWVLWRFFGRGDGTGKIGWKWVPLRKEGMWFARVRRANVICHVRMQRCCFVWVFFVWNSRLRSKSTPDPKQQLGTMSFLSLLRWKKTHIPNRLSWKHMNQMETHPMAKRRGQASVQLFGCSVTTTCGL